MKARLLVLSLLVGSVTPGPLGDWSNNCATTCKPSQKFNYETGKTYSYDYDVRTETSMDGASENKAMLAVRGRADIEVISQCDLVLVLKEMAIYESSSVQDDKLVPASRSQELRRLLEATPLRFSFQDGVVAELCPSRSEDGWALNVKRGVLSALQNSMETLEGTEIVQEADVTGRCQAKYEVTSNGWYTMSIKRSKDLLGCTDRHDYEGSVQSTPYQTASNMQSLPLMKSDHQCTQEVSSRILKSSTCVETHTFRPFSSQNGGARTTVTQKLTFKSASSGVSTRTEGIQSRSQMPFDHGYDLGSDSDMRARAERVLDQLCSVTEDGVHAEVPRMFSQLVGVVKKMDASDIRDIYNQLKSKTICSNNNQRTLKFFTDALPMAGTSQTVSMMKDLMVTGDVTGKEVDLWLMLLAFIKEPTSDMLSSVKELLDADALKQRAMLPVSTLVNNYCKSRDDCDSDFGVNGIIAALSNDIGNCYVTENNIKTVLLSLSALGNTGHSRAATIATRCLSDRAPMEVRVAAAKSFRRMSCDTDKNKLMDIFKDGSEDSELRIEAYLQLMTCPTLDILRQIQDVIEEEPEKSQLGSFVTTHIHNLQESSSPLKQDMKEMVKSVQISKQFEMNPVKFSRNYEKSVFLKMLNSGAQAESNLIWSSQSSLPRSLAANFSVELFGHSVNLLEVGGRIEGLEYLMETLLGPYSFLRGAGETTEKQARLDELKGSIYARVFGNELMFNRFRGINSLVSGKTFNMLDVLIKLSKDHDFSFTQSLQLLDSSMTVPTASGLPLRLSVNATATVDIRALGKMDLRKVSSSPRSLQIEGELRPSGAVSVDGVMSLDAKVSRTALKVSGTMHSSLALKGRVELERGKVLNVQIDTPDDKLEIFDIRSRFFIIRNGDEREQKMITENRKEFKVCTGDALARFSGAELCGELQFPNASLKTSGPYFPFTGPSSFSIVLYKRDTHTGYKLLAKRVENSRSSVAQLSFDTPGSSITRAVSFDLMINYDQKEVEIAMASPWKKVSLNGGVVNDAGLNSLTGTVTVDDTSVYSLTAEVKIESKDNLVEYTPVLEIVRPDAGTAALRGSVQVDVKGRTLNSDLTLTGVTESPLQLQATYTNTESEKGIRGSFNNGKKQYSANIGTTMDIKTPKKGPVSFEVSPVITITVPSGQPLSLVGNVQYREDRSLSSEFTLEIPSLLDKGASFKGSLTKKTRKSGSHYDIEMRFKSRPFTSKLDGQVQTRDGLVTSKLSFDYNIQRVGADRLSLNAKFSDKSTSAYKKYTLTTNVDFKQNPDWNVDLNVDVNHKKKRSEGEVRVVYGNDPKDKSKQVYVSAVLDRRSASLAKMDVEYKAKATVPALGLDASVSGAHAHETDSLVSNINVVYGKDRKVSAAVTLRNTSDDQLKLVGQASLSYPGQNFSLETGIKEKSDRQYVHTLVVKRKGQQIVSASSSYKSASSSEYEVTSEIDADGFKRLQITGFVNTDLQNLQLNSKLTYSKDTYGLTALSKISRGPRGKWTFDLVYPDRHVVMNAEGGLKRSNVETDFELAWDKDNDESAKVSLQASGTLKNAREATSASGRFILTTPFKPVDYLSASMAYDDDSKRYGVNGKMTLGGKSQQISSSLNLVKPLSLRNVQVTWEAETPFQGLKRMDANIAHSVDDSTINTLVKISQEKDSMQLSVKGMNGDVTFASRNLKGDVSFKSSLGIVEDVSLSVTHADDGSSYKCSGEFTRNGDRYQAQLNMDHSFQDWQLQNRGTLRVTMPANDITTTWEHANSLNDVRCSLTTSWDSGREMTVNVNGRYDQNDDTSVTGSLSVRSPWKTVRDLTLTLSHQMGSGRCTHSTTLVHNGQKKASTSLQFSTDDSATVSDFALTWPLTADITAKLDTKYAQFPYSGHVQLQWTPRSVIAVDASLSSDVLSDVEGYVRFTSPFQAARSVMAKASNKQEDEDMVSKISLDYGVRQTVSFESRIRPQTLTLARAIVKLPLDTVSTIDAGYSFSGQSQHFDASADFAVEPILGKYSTSLLVNGISDYMGRLRVTTPHRQFPYGQLTLSSRKTSLGRASNVEAEIAPRQIYSLSTVYSFEKSIIFSAAVETPVEDYRKFAVSIKHNQEGSTLLTQGEVHYPPEKTVEGSLNIDWTTGFQGALQMKTPFSQYEDNRISVRHDGDWNDLNSHAEVEVGGKRVAADATFKHSSSSTEGKFILNIPVEGFETTEVKLNKRGFNDDFRSSASVSYAKQKFEAKLNHKLNARLMKTSASFTSPYTENMDLSVEYKPRGPSSLSVSTKYGQDYSLETDASLDMSQRDVSASTTVKYKLGSSQQVIAASVGKKGEWEAVSLTGSFTSPFTEDLSVQLDHSCQLPNSLTNTLHGNYGTRYNVLSETTFRYQESDLATSASLKLTLDGKASQHGASFNMRGDLSNGNLQASAKCNDKSIDLTGSLDTRAGIRVNVRAKTPFPSFEDVGASFTSSGVATDFSTQGYLQYMTGKRVEHTITLKTEGLNVNLDVNIASPIRSLEKIIIKVQNSHQETPLRVSGSALLTHAWGTERVTYTMTLEDDNEFNGNTVIQFNGDQFEVVVARVPLVNGFRNAVTLKGPQTDVSMAVEYSKTDEKLLGKLTYSLNSATFTAEGFSSMTDDGDELGVKVIVNTPDFSKVADLSLTRKMGLNDLSLEAIGNYGNQQASASVVFKNEANELSGSVKVTTPLDDFRNLEASFKHSGDADRFSTESSVTYMDSKSISGKVTYYRYQWRRLETTLELTTPFPGMEAVKAEYRHSGSKDRYTCSSSVEYSNSKKLSADFRAELSPKYAVSLSLKSPFQGYQSLLAEGSLESLGRTHKLTSSLDLGQGLQYSLSGTMDTTSSPMSLTGKLMTPYKLARNVEATLTHQGQLDDFSTNAMFNSPLTEVIRGEVSLRYTSPFDLNAAAALSSQLRGVEDLRAEVRNTEAGQQKSGHLMVRWAPEQQISMDGTFASKDSWYNKEVSADLTLATPFEKLRSGKVRVQHAQTDQKYVPKVEVSLNGDTLLDADAEVNVVDNPSSVLTVRKPQPMQVTAALTSDSDKQNGEIYVNWNRDDANQNIRFKTSAKNVKTAPGRDMEYTLKVIHPLRTLGAGMSVKAQDRRVTSQGHLSWDEADNQKVFYELEVSDDSQNFRRVYDASVKVGVPTRTLEATGQYTDNLGTSVVDTSFAWDADRDTTKQIGFTAKVTSGTQTKADLTLRLPAIGKEVRIDSEVAVNQGRTVWDGKTALSYSTDTRKTLTLSSSLKDISDSYSGKNYSLAVAITHPYTDVDLKLTSYLGANDDRYSASVDAWYLTSRRQRKNMALRGEIDQLRRLISLQLVSPLKKVSVLGEVTSTDPYVISLTNRYDDSDVIRSDITLDSGKRSIVFQSNYDLDNPDNKLVLKAGYVDDSAIRAELFRQQSSQQISDSLLTVRLNTSTLLHTRLAWRPQSLADLQDYTRVKAGKYTSSINAAVRDAYDAVGEEIGAKYGAIANEMTSEAQPLLDLLDGELARLGQQLDKLRKELSRKYARNDFYIQDMGDQVKETYAWLRDALRDLSVQYEKSYTSLLKSLKDQLQEVRSFPIRQKYQETLQSLISSIQATVQDSFQSLSDNIASIDENLMLLRDGAQDTWDGVREHPHVMYVQDRVRRLGEAYVQAIDDLGNKIPQISIPEEYTAAIYNVRDRLNSSMRGLFQRPEFQSAKNAANEVYQQGLWAYRYWQVEENIKKSLKNIGSLLYQIIEEELEEVGRVLKFVKNSRVTTYDPEKGEIQVEIHLPLQLKSLAEVPDVQPYLQEVQDSVQAYLPDKSTVLKYIEQYSPARLWSTNASLSGAEEFRQDLEAFQPTVLRVRPWASSRWSRVSA